MAESVREGDEAPDFLLKTQDGDDVRLSDFRGKKAVVLFFYPKDGSPGCTAEACKFRDSYESFKEFGAEVLGISSQSVESHSIFSLNLGLPYRLLSDEGGKVRKAYGVPASLGLLPGRVTYVIDKQGIVRHVFSSQIDVEKHVDESLRILKGLEADKSSQS
ncbi:MAG TPA: peroxiredoxin [Thermoplasmata archaeon]|jgi:peroxiredoxin Q/BCP